MRTALLALLLCAGCSSASPAATGSGDGVVDSGGGVETSTGGGVDSGSPGDDAGSPTDAGAADGDAQCVLWVDDAGITHGCSKGGQGPGDQDDGGGAPAPPPPNIAQDAGNLGLGSPCWDNAQCTSDICFDYAVRGTFCTQRCFTNANCPPPMNGCNGMGVCRMGDGGS
jgi:hypothetical protein